MQFSPPGSDRARFGAPAAHIPGAARESSRPGMSRRGEDHGIGDLARRDVGITEARGCAGKARRGGRHAPQQTPAAIVYPDLDSTHVIVAPQRRNEAVSGSCGSGPVRMAYTAVLLE